MKRAGFTMIELIFVIVIIGILSAVALPRFLGVSQQAHDAKVKAFVSTLNGTVGPTMWSKSLTSGASGLVKTECDSNMTNYIDEIPSELIFDDKNCSFDANSTAGGNYKITFVDGNATNSPRWTAVKQ